MKERLFVAVAAVLCFWAIAMAARAELEIEDVGPYKDAPGLIHQERSNRQLLLDPTAEMPNADFDRDGVPNGNDQCPDTPRLVGLFSIGETFGLGDLEFRYMGARGEQRIIHTLNLSDEEGENQECVLVSGVENSSCIIEGTPEIQIILLGEQGTNVYLIVRHRVDEMGCSPEP